MVTDLHLEKLKARHWVTGWQKGKLMDWHLGKARQTD